MGNIFSEDVPRPGPADQISGCWAATQPGPLHFRRRPGPSFFNFFARLIVYYFFCRPGPSLSLLIILGPVRPIIIFGSARPGPDRRPITSHEQNVYSSRKRKVCSSQPVPFTAWKMLRSATGSCRPPRTQINVGTRNTAMAVQVGLGRLRAARIAWREKRQN